MDNVSVKSQTSGRYLPGIVIKRSRLRAFLRMPSVRVAVFITTLKGADVKASWYYPSELKKAGKKGVKK